MKIDTQFLDDHQVKVFVEIDTEQMKSAKRRAARTMSKQTKIPGFRKGKAPYGVVLRKLGEQAILNQALDLLIDEVYPQVISESDINPYGPGILENVEFEDTTTIEFLVPLNPEINLGDYRSLDLPYDPPEVTEEEVDEAIDNLRERYAVVEPVNRPAIEGDIVTVQISGTAVKNLNENDSEEDESRQFLTEKSYPVKIKPEPDKEDKWPFPGFSRHLIGLSLSDEKEIQYTFPDDYEPKGSFTDDMKGKNAEFVVIVDSIRSHTLPEVNEEFAQMVSEKNTVDELRNSIYESIRLSNRNTYDNVYDDKIFEQLLQDATVRFPPQMIEDEVKSIKNDMQIRLSRQGIKFETFLDIRKMSEDEYYDEVKPIAESRIKRGLILGEVAKSENIQVDPQKLRTETNSRVKQISGMLLPQEFKRLSKKGLLNDLQIDITSDMLTMEAIEILRSIAKGEFKEAGDIDKNVESEDPDEGVLNSENGNIELENIELDNIEQNGNIEDTQNLEIPDSDNSTISNMTESN